MISVRSSVGLMAIVAVAVVGWPNDAAAHCDTLNGPVVSAARVALQQGNVTPVLKWVKASEEAEVREAFQQTMTVRRVGSEARELADLYFFETLVRLHRQGEGEPYTGLKPFTSVDPAIESADQALETGSVNDVVALVTEHAAVGIRARFALAQARQPHAGDSVAAGREYVKAYVEFIHYVEQLHLTIMGAAAEKD
ncbi:MAG: hypothetical protein HY048_16705 [Acidobacteria bacterium]|nr:hypothetical protein [Acidobacteriota bacterium]